MQAEGLMLPEIVITNYNESVPISKLHKRVYSLSAEKEFINYKLNISGFDKD